MTCGSLVVQHSGLRCLTLLDENFWAVSATQLMTETIMLFWWQFNVGYLALLLFRFWKWHGKVIIIISAYLYSSSLRKLLREVANYVSLPNVIGCFCRKQSHWLQHRLLSRWIQRLSSRLMKIALALTLKMSTMMNSSRIWRALLMHSTTSMLVSSWRL